MAGPDEIDELRNLLQGLLKLHNWQGELLAKAAALAEPGKTGRIGATHEESGRSGDIDAS